MTATAERGTSTGGAGTGFLNHNGVTSRTLAYASPAQGTFIRGICPWLGMSPWGGYALDVIEGNAIFVGLNTNQVPRVVLDAVAKDPNAGFIGLDGKVLSRAGDTNMAHVGPLGVPATA